MALPNRSAGLVLGMDRSGTSVLAGVLNALGGAAPKTLMPPMPDNPRGFFESVVLADAHDKLLADAGSHWHDWRRLDAVLRRSQAADRHVATIAALVVEEFGDA